MENNSPHHLSANGPTVKGSCADDALLISHASFSLVDAYIQPIWPPEVPHQKKSPPCHDEHRISGILLTDTTINANKEAWAMHIRDGKEDANIVVCVPSNVFEKWHQSPPCHNEHPISDILLTDTTINANKEAWAMHIRDGKEDANIVVCVPSNVFEKWHQAFLSLASSAFGDAYIQPIWSPVPHRKKRVVLFELGRHVTSAGELPQKPSLPYSFLPTLCAVGNKQYADDKTMITCGGANTYKKNVTVVRQPALVLYSYDVTTGVVVDLGEDLANVPGIDDFVVDGCVKTVKFGAPQIRGQMLKGIDLQKLLNIFGKDGDATTVQLFLRYICKKLGTGCSGTQMAILFDSIFSLRMTGAPNVQITLDALYIRASDHEGGHTTLAWILPDADYVVYTELFQNPTFALGITVYRPQAEYTFRQMYARLIVLYGGTVAEELLHGEAMFDRHDHEIREYVARYLEHFYEYCQNQSYPYIANSYLPPLASIGGARKKRVESFLREAKRTAVQKLNTDLQRARIATVGSCLRYHWRLNNVFLRSILGRPESAAH